MGLLYRYLLRPYFFRLDPEAAHDRAVKGMELLGKATPVRKIMEHWNQLSPKRCQPISAFGLKFPNAVGLAPGFDKNATCWQAAAALGFGHVEVGTVTRQGQPGNPSPRMFRYPKQQAVINRMGFNNDGAEVIAKRLQKDFASRTIPVGVNIGKTKTVSLDHAARDYEESFDLLADYADYITINISSPNTPDLRKLQEDTHLDLLLGTLQKANRRRQKEDGKARKPLLLKIAPDLTYRMIDQVLEKVFAFEFDGIIATNTTIQRPPPFNQENQAGGLSGKPLRQKSTEVIRYIHQATNGTLPIIGTGGILDPVSAGEKMDAGATLIQIYTGMIYEGPFFPRELARALAAGQKPWAY
ncbi:MAG: quinone-dependent dihydroorotate dehydrogenase [Opitutales bacterium]|nr:quinone-dependent dihydroorotate dehydrogenase [Opitutales bacterium]